MVKLWQASEARHDFKEVVDAAVRGEPQFIRRRDGQEVVIVSREYFEKTQPTLKSYLLSDGIADGDDAFDEALRDLRREGSPFIDPGTADVSE